MSEFQIDLRLPARVFRRSPFIYAGPDLTSLPLGLVSDIVAHRGKNIQRLYPFTVISTNEGGDSVDHLFCFVSFYINDKGERVVFMTPPVSLLEPKSPGALEALLSETEKLAKFIDARFIDVEIHDGVNGAVAFPTSLSFFSYLLDGSSFQGSDDAFFRQKGFRDVSEITCYEQSIAELERVLERLDKPSRESTVYPLSPSEYKSVREEAREFPVTAFSLTRSDDEFGSTMLPFFEETAYAIRQSSGWLRQKSQVAGYLRWCPDLMELLSAGGTPYPLMFPDALESYPYTCGKIFDWGLKKADRELFFSLLAFASKSMKRRGIDRLQFAHVSGTDGGIQRCLVDSGFSTVQSIKLLRKEVR